jgi:gliding motility-associated-like protein
MYPVTRNLVKIFTIFITIIPFRSQAQLEYSKWYLGYGNGIDFNYDPPRVISDAPGPPNYSPFGTISDYQGHLLFYLDKSHVWNSKNELMENGDNLNGVIGSSDQIISFPGSDSLFYIFHLGLLPHIGVDYSDKDVALMYSVVDISANNGKGRVLKKNKVLYSDLHGSFTIAGNCTLNEFWLIGDADRNWVTGTDEIFVFHIDKNGLDTIPIISIPANMGLSYGHVISPKGDKIVYYYGSTAEYEFTTVISDFNLQTGIVSKAVMIRRGVGMGAFSSSGKYLYVSYYPDKYFNNESSIYQYDVSNNNTSILIAKASTFLGTPRLAPNGKIYMIKDSVNTGVINDPEKSGLACNFKIGRFFIYKNPLDLDIFPQTPTYLFYTDSLNANAGKDREICANSSTQLGVKGYTSQIYRWEPSQYLSNPNLSNPIFKFPQNPDSSLDLIYELTIFDRACKNKDNVKIIVHPYPLASIDGSRSVCPGVEEVDYWSKQDSAYNYNWSLAGGELVQGQGTDSIKVNWGPTNPNAWVGLKTTNQFNCRSDQNIFNVRINVELDTETPRGLENVCINLPDSNFYQITRTNGSVYTWGIEGGSIIQGQGSNKVNVNWDENGNHLIWVLETSSTIDTVCYGVSDTVQVKLFKDSLQAQINFVSVDPSDETKGILSGRLINNPTQILFQVDVLRSENGYTSWGIIESVKSDSNKIFLRDQKLDTDHNIYEYRLQMVNGCKENIMSEIHNTIQLQGTNDEKQNTIQLVWNPYCQWPEGVDHYELYRKLDKETVFLLYKSFNGSQLSYLSGDGIEGFDHNFLIKAVSSDPVFYSWSNQIGLNFKHPLFIPNVITPNGDGFNDTFEIIPIELYSENYLIITNRWGKKVFEQKNYKGGWNSANEDAGVYYYELYVKRSSKVFKGWLEVLK